MLFVRNCVGIQLVSVFWPPFSSPCSHKKVRCGLSFLDHLNLICVKSVLNNLIYIGRMGQLGQLLLTAAWKLRRVWSGRNILSFVLATWCLHFFEMYQSCELRRNMTFSIFVSVLSQNLNFHQHMPWSFLVFNDLKWKIIVHFVNVGGIVYLSTFFLIPSKLGLHDRFHGWSKIILSFWSIDLTPSFLYNLHTYYKWYYQAESVKILVWTCAGFPFSRTYRNFMFDMCFHQNKRELMDFFTLKLDN